MVRLTFGGPAPRPVAGNRTPPGIFVPNRKPGRAGLFGLTVMEKAARTGAAFGFYTLAI